MFFPNKGRASPVPVPPEKACQGRATRHSLPQALQDSRGSCMLELRVKCRAGAPAPALGLKSSVLESFLKKRLATVNTSLGPGLHCLPAK